MMALSNMEQGSIWIDAWDNLEDLIKKYPEGHILVPEFKEVDAEGARPWMQESAYKGNRVQLTIDYHKGRKSIFLNKVPA